MWGRGAAVVPPADVSCPPTAHATPENPLRVLPPGAVVPTYGTKGTVPSRWRSEIARATPDYMSQGGGGAGGLQKIFGGGLCRGSKGHKLIYSSLQRFQSAAVCWGT